MSRFLTIALFACLLAGVHAAPPPTVKSYPSPDGKFQIVSRPYQDSFGSPTRDILLLTKEGQQIAALETNAGALSSVNVTWNGDSTIAVAFLQFPRATMIVSAQLTGGQWRLASGPAVAKSARPVGLSRVTPAGWDSPTTLSLTTEITYRDRTLDNVRSTVKFLPKRVEEVSAAGALVGLWTINYTP